MLSGRKHGARDIARRSALGLAGVLFAGVGVGFLTAAAFQGLSIWNGPIVAALVLGGVYLGLGLIFLALSKRDEPPAREIEIRGSPMLRVVDAFFEGVEAGASARRAPLRGRG
jgi:hypothetical protein